MALHCLVPSSDWDFPIFKVLASNDTGTARGHQGGVVIPKELRLFFPGLSGTVSAERPTIDQRVEAQLFVENTYKGTVSTRYQFQTWGGARSPESRLTDQLGAMRNLAAGGDVLIVQRSIDRLDHYRLTLVRKSFAEFATVAVLIAGRKWGVLANTTPPVSDDDLEFAREEESAHEAAPFALFDSAAATTTSTVKKVARSIVFRSKILDLYEETCAVCSEALRAPSGVTEVDAAHVVPRSVLGSDDARNGLALCKRHHWAFDKGLFGVGDDRKIIVPNIVSALAENISLKQFNGRPIREATNATMRVHPSAFEWHREYLLLG